ARSARAQGLRRTRVSVSRAALAAGSAGQRTPPWVPGAGEGRPRPAAAPVGAAAIPNGDPPSAFESTAAGRRAAATGTAIVASRAAPPAPASTRPGRRRCGRATNGKYMKLLERYTLAPSCRPPHRQSETRTE